MKQSNFKISILAFIMIAMINVTFIYAEGTKQLSPVANDVAMLYTNNNTFGDFASYVSNSNNRLLFRIKNAGTERVYIGLSQRASTENATDGQLGNLSNYWFRVKNSAGVIVHGPIQVTQATANANTWALAAAGPSAIVGASGYPTPTGFLIPTTSLITNGNYYIEFSSNQNSDATGNDPVSGSATSTISIKFFDITVASTTPSLQAIPGRVWSNNWVIRTPKDFAVGGNGGFTDQWNRPFNGSFYVFSDNDLDGVLSGFVNRINFANSGLRGLTFETSFNATGTKNTADVVSDRKSVENQNSTLSEYPIFLNNPDPTIWLDKPVGTLSLSELVIECGANMANIELESDATGQIEILLDLDNTTVGGYDFNSADVILATKITPAPGDIPPYLVSIPWDIKDGLGNVVPSGTTINIYAKLQQGVFHFPVYDVERMTNGFLIQEVRPLGGNFSNVLFFDDSNLKLGNASLVPDANKVQLTGCVTPCHTWNNFNPSSPNTLGYGNLNTVNTWWVANRNAQSSSIVQFCSLPIELTYFNATTQNNWVDLNWQTNSEIDNQWFDIERRYESLNSFEKIGRVDGNGTTSITHQYAFVDDEINWQHTGAYYRLKQINFDGSFEYSPVVYTALRSFDSDIIIAPNPVIGDVLTIKLPTHIQKDAMLQISIYNLMGQQVANYSPPIFSSSDIIHWVQHEKLHQGEYLLVISTKEGVWQKLFTKL